MKLLYLKEAQYYFSVDLAFLVVSNFLICYFFINIHAIHGPRATRGSVFTEEVYCVSGNSKK